MKAESQVMAASDVEVSITITATLAEWRAVIESLEAAPYHRYSTNFFGLIKTGIGNLNATVSGKCFVLEGEE